MYELEELERLVLTSIASALGVSAAAPEHPGDGSAEVAFEASSLHGNKSLEQPVESVSAAVSEASPPDAGARELSKEPISTRPRTGLAADRAGRPVAWLDARRLAEEISSNLLRHNQYLAIGPVLRQRLEMLCTQLLVDLAPTRSEVRPSAPRDEMLTRVLSAHRQGLRDWCSELFADNIGLGLVAGGAVCEEYSCELQLRVLGIRLEDLDEPVLDLGCGPNGHLVHYLAARGKAAWGVDRAVEPSDRLMRADWFDLDLVEGKWGTILSHMAFSNHFLHHHLRPDGHPERHATLYMAILRSLQPGGSFHYAPGLPFIERLLPPDRYRVHRVTIGALAGGSIDAALVKAYGEGVLYGCKVTKVSA